MKECNCSLGTKLLKICLKLIAICFGAIAVLFIIFFFDLDGKLLYHVVEPFLKNHYDQMERKDVLKDIYDVDKYPKREFDV